MSHSELLLDIESNKIEQNMSQKIEKYKSDEKTGNCYW